MSTFGYAKPGGTMTDFYEDDEPIEVVLQQFDEGMAMVSVEPLSVLDVAQAHIIKQSSGAPNI